MRLSRFWCCVLLVCVFSFDLCLPLLCVHAEVNTSDWWDIPYEVATSDVEWDNNYLSLFPPDEEDSAEAPTEVSADSSSDVELFEVELFDLTEEDYNNGDVSFNFRVGEKYTNDSGAWVFNTKADLWWYASYGLSGLSRTSTAVFDDFPLSYCQEWRFSSGTNKKLLSAGDKVSVEITNIFSELEVYNQDYDVSDAPLFTYRLDPSALDFRFYAYDLNGQFIDIVSNSKLVYSNSDKTYNLIVDVSDASADVYRLVFFVFPDIFDFGADDYLDGDDYVYYINFGYENGSINFDFTPEDSTEGLLSGLISWVKGIFETVVNGFANVINAIVELPGKLISLLSDLLQSLFIPTQEELEVQAEKWDMLLQSRFGAIYTATNLIIDFCNNILTLSPADQTSIDFPPVTVNLAGTDFTFGGFAVSVIPEGFNFLVGSVKSVVAILVTLLFVNALKKRFEKLLGGEES